MRAGCHTDGHGATGTFSTDVHPSAAKWPLSSAPVSRERPGDRVRRGGGEDLRLAPKGRRKAGLRCGAIGAHAHEACRQMVLEATRGWSGGAAVNRASVAMRLGVGERVLDRMMSPGDDLQFRAEHLLVLLAARDLVPEESRLAAGRTVAEACGCVLVPLADPEAHPTVNAAVMGLAEAAGQVARLAREAKCDGAVCAAMTPERRAAIETAARSAVEASDQVVAAARVAGG